MCASCVHLWIKLLAQVEFSSSLNQTAEYLQMKGCTSKCLLLDTEGVIVSPSADLPFNGGLSDASHGKVCVALLYLDGCTAGWPKCFTLAPILRVAFTLARDGESRRLCKIPPWMQFQRATMQMVQALYELITPIPCHVSITLSSRCGWLLWLHSCFPTFHIHHTENQSFSLPFFAPTTSDWHCTEMQNNNPLIT